MTRLINNGLSLQFGGNTISMPTRYDDWFLPSTGELTAMYNELKVYGVGDFNSALYWSSTEFNATNAHYVNFITGVNSLNIPKGQVEVSRASRSFSGTVGQYSYRDIGPAGGWIYWFENSTYFEAAPSDFENSVWSYVLSSIGSTNFDIGTGQDNTLAIINQVGHTGSAAQLCVDYYTFGVI